MKTLIFAAATIALAAPAAAQTQAEMNRGADIERRSADAAMTREWTATNTYMKRRDAADRSRGGGFGYAAALLASQRAWLQFRDTQCVIEGGALAGGSMQPMAQAQCLARLSRERGKQLSGLRWSR